MPKEMAPKVGIGTCDATPDKTSFDCTVSCGYVCALIRGQKLEKSNETKISVETHIVSLIGVIATGVLFVVLSIILEGIYIHPKVAWEWFIIPISVAVFSSMPIFFIPLNKQVLDRFIRDMLLADS